MTLTRETTLDTAKELIAGERARTYGDATENFAKVGIVWGIQLGIDPIPASVVGLMMTTLKIVRLAETNNHEDSYIDAAGYIALAAEAAFKTPEA